MTMLQDNAVRIDIHLRVLESALPDGLQLFPWDGHVVFPVIGASGSLLGRFVAYLVRLGPDVPNCRLRTASVAFPSDGAEKHPCGCVVSAVPIAAVASDEDIDASFHAAVEAIREVTK